MQKLLVAAIAVVVLVLGAAVPALAINTQAWEERRIATEAFDAAADAALDASEDAATWVGILDDARAAAEPVLEDASAVASAAPGFFNSAVLDPLTDAVAALGAALAAEAPDGIAMPDTERPESVEELRAGVEPLQQWADAEVERTFGIMGVATDVLDATIRAEETARALAETVGAEASGTLGAAPLASAESRAAVEAARDAVLTAIEDGGELSKSMGDYVGAVAAVRASQQAAEAAAAAAAESQSGNNMDDVQQRLMEMLRGMPDQFGNVYDDCYQDSPTTWICY